MKSLTSLSNPSLIGHSLVMLPGETWSYFTKKKSHPDLDLGADRIITTLTSADNGRIEYVETVNRPLLVKWAPIALCYIFGGVLALGMTLTLLPLGFGFELLHYCGKEAYDLGLKIKESLQKTNREET